MNIYQSPSASRLLHHHDDQHHPPPEPVPLRLPDSPQQEHLQRGPAEDQGHDLSQQAKGSKNLRNLFKLFKGDYGRMNANVEVSFKGQL